MSLQIDGISGQLTLTSQSMAANDIDAKINNITHKISDIQHQLDVKRTTAISDVERASLESQLELLKKQLEQLLRQKEEIILSEKQEDSAEDTGNIIQKLNSVSVYV